MKNIAREPAKPPTEKNLKKIKYISHLTLFIAITLSSNFANAETSTKAQKAANFVESFQKTCTAYNQSGSISFNLATFAYIPESGEVMVGVIIKNDHTGQGFGTLTQTSLSELDPRPSFEDFTRGNSSVPVIKFQCANSACARNIGGAGEGTIGYIMIPDCSGGNKLANAFSQLIKESGGKASAY
ncbi:hypothetical protein [Pseudomonas sp. MWU12-2029]|uniref:hypothetical protein n=1 Tax=Pseudomonas sp. MWU12-2029 TaxID=2927805 RepID=UPI00200EE43C|nr:hypothetical protein [Pseudomonas sp. MWU12-2029]